VTRATLSRKKTGKDEAHSTNKKVVGEITRINLLSTEMKYSNAEKVGEVTLLSGFS